MAPVYTDKKTGRLYIEFQYKGHRHKERLPKGTTKKDAEKIEVKAKNDLMFQAHGIETKSSVMTFKNFIEEVFGPIADNYPKRRYDRLVLLVQFAYRFIKDKPMRSIKAADIERIKTARAILPTMHKTVRKPATIEREMSELSSIFTMAVDNDIIDYNPCGRVKKLSFDNIQDKILSRADEQKFFNNMTSQWAKDVCKMVLNTGLRRNDLMGLMRFQIDRENNIITLVQGKVKRRVIVILNSVAREIIDRRWRNGNKYLFASPVTGNNKGSVTTSMRTACIKAKIPILTIRDLRRTYGTRMAEITDPITTARSLGHFDLRMLPRYVRNIELMQKAADDLVQPVRLKAVK